MTVKSMIAVSSGRRFLPMLGQIESGWQGLSCKRVLSRSDEENAIKRFGYGVVGK